MDMIMKMVVNKYKIRNPNAYAADIQTALDITDLAREVEKQDLEIESLKHDLAQANLVLKNIKDNPSLLDLDNDPTPYNDGSNP